MSYFLRLLFITVVAITSGCGSDYREFVKIFPERHSNLSGTSLLGVRAVFVTRPGSIYELRGLADIVLSEQILQIDSSVLFHNKIQLPVDTIISCSVISFSKKTWEVKLLTNHDGFFVGIFNSKEVLDWCYENGIPTKGARDIWELPGSDPS